MNFHQIFCHIKLRWNNQKRIKMIWIRIKRQQRGKKSLKIKNFARFCCTKVFSANTKRNNILRKILAWINSSGKIKIQSMWHATTDENIKFLETSLFCDYHENLTKMFRKVWQHGENFLFSCFINKRFSRLANDQKW